MDLSGAWAILIVFTVMGLAGIPITKKLDEYLEKKHSANTGGLATA